jgi:5-methylthioadenosine/S-adenosylhomocysteine deaminase
MLSYELPEREGVDLLVTGGTVVTMDGERRIYKDGAVAIRGSEIVYVGSAEEARARYDPKEAIDAAGKIVMPGLVNSHTHAAMSVYRGIADDLPLMEWLQNYIFPAEAKNTNADMVYHGTRLACAEMIKGGTTTFCDMYYFEDRAAQAAKEAGMRAVLGETVLDFPAPDAKDPAGGIAYAERFIQQWKGDDLITPAVAPHAPYTVGPQSLKSSKELADRYQVPLVIHLSETQSEVQQISQKYGRTPTDYLDSIGLLDRNVVAAHCVWLTDAEKDLLASKGVGIAHNPESNMKLASGVAPVPDLIARGAYVGLGTDGAASNNDLDMFGEMDTAAKLHKISSGDPTAMPAEQVVEMATIGGARALHMGDRIGSLEAGKKADLIVLGTDSPNMTPRYNVYSHIVYAADHNDVETSVINGRVVMRDRELLTMDEDAVKAEGRRIGDEVARNLGIDPQ